METECVKCVWYNRDNNKCTSPFHKAKFDIKVICPGYLEAIKEK